VIALLGRRDQPTDAVEDYCGHLGEALLQQGCSLSIERVRWPDIGWLRSLFQLWGKSRCWNGQWVLVQYTSLMWSRRGFPAMFLAMLLVLKVRGARVAALFHDTEPYPGARLVDRTRRMCQCAVMRSTYWLADKTISMTPVEYVSWLRPDSAKATFIPVGSNISAVAAPRRSARNRGETKTIAVFGITGDGKVGNEVSEITFVAKAVAKRVSGVRLLTLGRGSAESEPRFRKDLRETTIEFAALGILPSEEVGQVLSNSDVSLFVRGPLSTQRGSAIASIACGVPLVAYAGQRLPQPFMQAGVVTADCGDYEALAAATVKVLTDGGLWLELHDRSRNSYDKYFSWSVIANRFMSVLNDA
jgi:glycosyltransferase involved in cell wall biosynthesis